MIGTSDLQNFIVRYLLPPVGCVVAAFTTVYIISEINPMAAALLCASAIFFIVAVVAPRAGLLILLGLAGYSDLLKRLLIFLSDLTFEQLSYVLAAAPLVVSGLVVALLTRWAFHTVKIQRRDFLLGVLVIVAMGLAFLLEWRVSKQILESAKAAVNNGLYVAMMPIATTFLAGKDDVLKVLRAATLIFLPVAVYGILQSFFGFADFELDYLRTGLTITASEESPRPFSTLNSAGAMGDMTALMAILSLIPYVATRDRDLSLKPLFFPGLFVVVYLLACTIGGIHFSFVVGAAGLLVSLVPFVVIAGEDLPIARRVVPLVFFALFSTACVCSLVRHSYFMLLASIVGIFCFRSVWRTRIFYSMGAVLAAALLFSASYLLQNLAAWDPAANARTQFGERALGIQTYAERLKGFENLTGSLDMYSAFGLPVEQKMTATTYQHDPISAVLVDYGLIALLAMLGGFVGMLYYAHRRVLALPAGTSRLLGVVLLSMMIAVLASHVLFAGVLGTFPVNLFFWLFAGCLFCLIAHGDEENRRPAADLPIADSATPARWAMPLEPHGERHPVSPLGQRR